MEAAATTIETEAGRRASDVLTFRTRGVHYFAGRVRCPLAGVGSRGSHDSNRLVLDDRSTEVTIDRGVGRITVRNDRAYADKTVIADLMFLAEGALASGGTSPMGVHLKVMKEGNDFSVDLHRHLRQQGPYTGATFEPFEVWADDGGRAVRVHTRDDVLDVVRRPSLALRIVKWFMAMKDNPIDRGARERGTGSVADLSVGFGALGFDYMVARAELASLAESNLPLLAAGSLPRMLGEGAWEMRLTALSERWLPEVVKRDLFLFGLDEVPLLAKVRERGLAKGECMWFRFEPGRGTIGLDAREADLPQAVDVARAYLEFHMLGGLLAERLAPPSA